METIILQTTTVGVVCPYSFLVPLIWSPSPFSHSPLPATCILSFLSLLPTPTAVLYFPGFYNYSRLYTHIWSLGTGTTDERKSLAFVFLSSLHGIFSRPSTKLQILGLHFSLQLNSISLSILPHFHYTFMCWRIFGVMNVVWLGHMVNLFLFLGGSPYQFPKWLGKFVYPPTVNEGSLCLMPHPEFTVNCFVHLLHSVMRWDLNLHLPNCCGWWVLFEVLLNCFYFFYWESV